MAGILAVSRPGISMMLERCAGISDSSKHQRLELSGLPCNLVAAVFPLVWAPLLAAFCRARLSIQYPSLENLSLFHGRWGSEVFVPCCVLQGGIAESNVRKEFLRRVSCRSSSQEWVKSVLKSA